MALSLWAGSSMALVSTYIFSSLPGSYTALTTETILWSTTFDDNSSASIPIPGITVNGTAYTNMFVQANGWITLGGTSIASSYAPISQTTAYSVVISAYGRDLNNAATGTPKISYNTNDGGDIVVQFQDVRRYNVTGERLSFQIRLHVSSGCIKIVYGGTITGGTSSSYPQVGLRGTTNSDYNNRTTTTNWTATTAGVANTSTCLMSTTVTPTVGLTYIWCPSTLPVIIVNPANLNLGYVHFGGFSAVASYLLSGNYLTSSPIVVSAPTNFEVSLSSGGPFGANVSVIFTPPILASTQIFVRFAPTATNTDYSGNITNAGGGASVNVAVTGTSWEYKKWCTSNATSALDEEIFNVSVGTINNTSDCSTTAPGPGSIKNEYSNYYYDVAPADLARTTSPAFSVQIGTCGTTAYSNAVKIFIDFNQDGDFADAGEEVYVSPTYTAGAHVETGSLLIPMSASLGYTMMRIVNVETTLPGGITSCGTYGYGETEDYMVNIIAAPACPAPVNLIVTAYGHQAHLAWTETGTATLWDVEYGLAGFNHIGGTTILNLANPFTDIFGLLPSTGYDYYVRANCGGGIYSTWSGPKTFTTTVSCPAPVLPVASLITATGATVNWTPTGVETAWTIHFGPAGFVNNSGVGYDSVVCTATKPYPLINLNHSTGYDFYVRACCGVGDLSLWSAKGTFATLCNAIIPTPWSEGFEGMTTVGSKILPPCWSYENVVGTGGPFSSATTGTYYGPRSGIHFIYTLYSNTTWVFTPQMLLSNVSYDFSFYMMNKYPTSPIDFLMDVAYGTTNNSAGMTNILASSVVCSNSSYVKFTYTFTPTANTYYFGVKTVSATSGPWYISFDDFRLEPTPPCLLPLSCTITGITSSSAFVGWTGATTVDIDYGPVGHIAGTGPGFVNGTSANPQLIAPLSANTSYDVYIRQDCGGGLYSTWFGPVTCKTLCNPIVPGPWCYGFDDMLITGNNILPDCWKAESPTGTPWSSGTAASITYNDPCSAPNYVYVYYIPSAADKFLITPGFTLSHNINYEFRFKWVGDGFAGWTGDVMVNTAQTGAGATLLGVPFLNAGTTTSNNCILTKRTFQPILDGTYYFMVRVNNSGVPYYLGFDDFCVDLAPACLEPVNLTATNITQNTASLNWTSTGLLFDIEWGDAGFTPLGIPTVSNIPGSSLPFTLSGLLENHCYSYYVRENCGGDPLVYSTWAGPYTFCTLCGALPFPYYENFDAVIAPAIPACMTVTNDNADAVSWKTNTSYSRSAPNSMWISYNTAVAMNDWFFTPAITLAVGTYKVSFWYRSSGISYPEKLEVKWGTKAEAAFMTNGPIFNNPAIQSTTYTEGTGNMVVTTAGDYYVGWHGYSDADMYFMCVDDISITQSIAHDVGTSLIGLAGIVLPTTPITPTAAVTNYGANPEAFIVTMTMSNGYVSTKPVTGLGVGLTTTVTFDPWIPTIGVWTVGVCTGLSGDLNTLNDCKSQMVSVQVLRKVYAYVAYDPTTPVPLPEGPAWFYAQTPGTITSLAPTTSGQFIAAGTWADGVWYGSEYYDATLSPNGGGWWSINETTGAMNLIADIDIGFTGISFNKNTNMMYGTEWTGTTNNLYVINRFTGSSSLIGSYGAGELMINLASDGSNYLYSIGISSDVLYRIDPSVPSAVAVGPTGFNFNYAQDMEWDCISNVMFVAGYTTLGSLYVASLSTGACTPVGNFQDGCQMTGMAIPCVVIPPGGVTGTITDLDGVAPPESDMYIQAHTPCNPNDTLSTLNGGITYSVVNGVGTYNVNYTSFINPPVPGDQIFITFNNSVTSAFEMGKVEIMPGPITPFNVVIRLVRHVVLPTFTSCVIVAIPPHTTLKIHYTHVTYCANTDVFYWNGLRWVKYRQWNWNKVGDWLYIQNITNRPVIYCIHNDDRHGRTEFDLIMELPFILTSPSNANVYALVNMGCKNSPHISCEFGNIIAPTHTFIDYEGAFLDNFPSRLGTDGVQNLTIQFESSDNNYWSDMNLMIDLINVTQPGTLHLYIPDATIPNVSVTINPGDTVCYFNPGGILSPGPHTMTVSASGGLSMGIDCFNFSSAVTIPEIKTLNLSYVFPEGLYAGSGLLNPSYDDLGLHWPAGVSDHITVELHNASTYSTIEHSVPDVALSEAGTATVSIPAELNASYYITIKHRNCIETTSALPVNFSGAVISYAFSTQAQAYGNNMRLMDDGYAVIYTGDVNQDGLVDGDDLQAIGNLADYAGSGYVPEDITGDGLVDGSDLQAAGNNSDYAIGAVLP